MKLSSYINSLNDYELSTLNDFLGNARESVSFWGKRVITVQGYKGSFAINKLASKVMVEASQRFKGDGFNIEERREGKEITTKLIRFYQATDEIIKHKNWFTKLLIKISEFSVLPYTTRFCTEEGVLGHYFRDPSENDFTE